MKNKLIQQCRKTILALDQQHSQQLGDFLSIDSLLKGSVIVFKRKCGKSSCCCKKGQPHESLVVSRWIKGKLKVVYAKPEERSDLFAQRDRIRKVRRDKKTFLDLQKQILKKLNQFIKLKTEAYCPPSVSAKG